MGSTDIAVPAGKSHLLGTIRFFSLTDRSYLNQKTRRQHQLFLLVHHSSVLSTSRSRALPFMDSSSILSTIFLLCTFTCTSWFHFAELYVNGATFTFTNNCTQTIWPAITGSPNLLPTGFELPEGGTRVLQPPTGWSGRFWGRTGCNFNATGRGSCRTGDCGSGQIACNGRGSTAITIAEFSIDGFNNMDFYDISVVLGFNLPMMIEARGALGQDCQSTECTGDLNRLCPAKLRTTSGDACRSACNVSNSCGPTEYTRLFKNACPKAYTFATDDTDATFACPSAGDYVITFCPSQLNRENDKCSRPFQCGTISNISYPFWGGNRPEICGFPGFQLLNCQGDAPLLDINSRSYRVLGIDYPTQTLRVARQDLWNTTCPATLYNTSIDPKLFSFPQNYSNGNVNLYYDCTANQSEATTFSSNHENVTSYGTLRRNGSNHTNQFTCNRTGAVNFFELGKASNFTCHGQISVPVDQSAAQALSSYSASVTDLKDALASGFSIQWLNSVASCQGCVQAGGVCGYDPTLASIKCNTTSASLVEAPTAALAPALSPAPSPLHHLDSGYGESGMSFVEKVLIGTAIIVSAAVAAAVTTVCLRRRRLKRSQLGLNQEANLTAENFLLNNESLAPKKYKYSQIKRMTKSFSEKLGQGGYGSVYKGTLPNGQAVAVKLLKEADSNGEDFINEVSSISKTSHVNIVNLLGFCYERNRRALVYEFMPNKSLDKFISSNGPPITNCQLDWETLYKIAVGVARGLEYLHKGCNTRIVHFDIKPQNILLDEEFCPKISDFGLAKLCKKKQSILSMAGTRGTIGYIAPEVFSRNFGGASHKSDVYSYGMMVLEMAGARNISGVGSTQSSDNYFPDKIYEHVILQETRNLDDMVSAEENEATRKLFLVGFWCIQTIPSDRPSMSKVVEMLEGSLESIQIPPKPFLFTPASLGHELIPNASGDTEIESSVEIA